MSRLCDCDLAVSHNREARTQISHNGINAGNSVHSGVAIGRANQCQINFKAQVLSREMSTDADRLRAERTCPVCRLHANGRTRPPIAKHWTFGYVSRTAL
jgi:hypothetical protein